MSNKDCLSSVEEKGADLSPPDSLADSSKPAGESGSCGL
jgi:hypothetical protein